MSNGYFWPDLRYLKTLKGQTCLPLEPEILKTSQAVIKKIFSGGINSVYKAVGSISTVLAVPANLAQYESVQRWFIPSGWANLSFSMTEVTATEV